MQRERTRREALRCIYHCGLTDSYRVDRAVRQSLLPKQCQRLSLRLVVERAEYCRLLAKRRTQTCVRPDIGSAMTVVHLLWLHLSVLKAVRIEPTIKVTHTTNDQAAPIGPQAVQFHSLTACSKKVIRTSVLNIRRFTRLTKTQVLLSQDTTGGR